MIYKKGSVLVAVLFILVVLSLTGVGFSYRTILESRNTKNEAIKAQLRSQAQSAIAIAISRLITNNNEFDHRAEPWCSHKELASESWLAAWSQLNGNGEPVFYTDYQVVDEEGKLNLLFSSNEALETIGMTSQQIASLFDWMDGDDITQSEGAEKDYYLSSAFPVNCKNSSLECLDELFLIRGHSILNYWGEDENHNGVLDSHEDDGMQTYPPDNSDGSLQAGWVDLLTCYGEGLLNINTAPEKVLKCLPISSQAVAQIIAFRQFDENSSGNIEDHVFQSSQDIEQLQGLTEIDKEVLQNMGIFKSNHFRVFAKAVHLKTNLQYKLEVVVKINQDKPEILQWRIWK